MKLEVFDFELPQPQIAQRPAEPRDSSKLLICESEGRLGEWSSEFEFSHHEFGEIVDYLSSGDLLVLNDAKVLPVRLLGHRLLDDGEKGGEVEALLMRKNAGAINEWSAIMHLSARVKPGLKVVFEPGVVAEVVSTHEERLATEGEVRMKFGGLALEKQVFESWLEKHGHVPLPPYIERDDRPEDKKTYQTVYADKSGSAAAPTAGFHFTPRLLDALRAKGVEIATVTLHVGLGTFRPIKAENIDEHVMHEEVFEISEEFAAKFLDARKRGRRVVAVGTTVVRTLESWASLGAPTQPGVFKTRVFIKPGYRFQVVDALVTNFHLPKSSLLVLVGAAMGVGPMREAYAKAIEAKYRFFSYGDAMFIATRVKK